MNIKNKQGFTLVELLAVIVVLAIVMLIAVQSILPRMEEARRSVFALEANEAINAATTYWTSKSLKGSGGFPVTKNGTKCVLISTLVSEGYLDLDLYDATKETGYSGYIKVTKKESGLYLYNIWIQKNHNMAINGLGNNGTTNTDIAGEEVIEYSDGLGIDGNVTDAGGCPSSTPSST